MIKFLLLLSMISGVFHPAWADDHAYLTPYGALLKSYVSEGKKQGIHVTLVDYKGWGKDARHAEAVRLTGLVNPDHLSGKEAMAFWINAYNLLTIDLIIQQNERDSIKKIGGVLGNAWKDYHWTMGGKSYALDDIEHGILRKMGDPRIHMAINCASLSCPDLRAEAYTSEKLDQQLDEQVNKFLSNDQKGMRVTNSNIEASKIFEWFEKDFAGKGGVAAFIKSYASQVPKDAKVTDHFDYNWKLNGSW